MTENKFISLSSTNLLNFHKKESLNIEDIMSIERKNSKKIIIRFKSKLWLYTEVDVDFRNLKTLYDNKLIDKYFIISNYGKFYYDPMYAFDTYINSKELMDMRKKGVKK